MKTLESNALREARMLTKAKQAVLTSHSWLTIDDIARRTNSTVELTGALLRQWEREHQIFSIQHEGTDYFPSYIFEQDFQPHPLFASVLKVFATDKGSWTPAFWFVSVSGLLGGKRPLDLIHSEPTRVVAAAEDEVAGITHG